MARERSGERLARGLGWFSLGLGVSQLAAPRKVAQLIGVPDRARNRGALLAVGVRELMAGVGILSRRGQAPGWLWARVGGDLIDIALLSAALRSKAADKKCVAAALGAVAGVTALDLFAAQRLTRRARSREAGLPLGGPRPASYAVTINRPIDEVYRLWRQLRPIESDQELVEDLTNARLKWRSRDAELEYVVAFSTAPGGRGTEVFFELRYDVLGGALGATVAKLFGRNPALHVENDLRQFKQILETGEVVHSDASIHRGRHPARPSRADRRQPRGLEQQQPSLQTSITGEETTI
jgi:uncharacterized membrane protein